jgi:hypothetical protein
VLRQKKAEALREKDQGHANDALQHMCMCTLLLETRKYRVMQVFARIILIISNFTHLTTARAIYTEMTSIDELVRLIEIPNPPPTAEDITARGKDDRGLLVGLATKVPRVEPHHLRKICGQAKKSFLGFVRRAKPHLLEVSASQEEMTGELG